MGTTEDREPTPLSTPPFGQRPLPCADDPLAAVRNLVPMIRASAEEAEQNARLSDDVVASLVESGTMTLMVPACLGGGEAPPSVQLDVIEEMAHADASTGWAVMASMTSMGTLLSLLPDEGVARVLASENYICAGAVAPPGRATATDDGYVVSGRFSFGSGTAHAGWLIGGYALIGPEGDTVRNDAGDPRVLFGLVPASETILHSNWDVVGLVATASHDYEIPEQLLDNALIAPGDKPIRGGSLYFMGLKSLPGLGHAGVALGIARRALDEFREIASNKARPPSGQMNKHTITQRDFAEWTAMVKSARAFTHDAYNRLFDATEARQLVDPEMEADCRLASTHAVFTAADITRRCYLASGSVGLRNASTIQRCFRDAHAASQHLFTGPQVYVDAGRVYLATPGLTPAHLDLMWRTVTPPLPQ